MDREAEDEDCGDHRRHSAKLPTHLVKSIDAIRNVGNFAAHPLESKQSGEILDVEPGEAEWTLDVLESLFDFYFVQPARNQKEKGRAESKTARGWKACDEVGSTGDQQKILAIDDKRHSS